MLCGPTTFATLLQHTHQHDPSAACSTTLPAKLNTEEWQLPAVASAHNTSFTSRTGYAAATKRDSSCTAVSYHKH